MKETKESGPRFAKISPPRSRHVLARTRLFARLDLARNPLVVRGSILQTSADIAQKDPQPMFTTGFFILERLQ